MKIAKYLFAFLIPFAFALSCGGGLLPVNAFDPWNQRHYPGSTTTSSPTVNKVGATGTLTWQAIDEVGYANWRNDVAQSLDSGSSDGDSLANVYNRFLASENRGRISIREAGPGEPVDLRHFGVTSAFMEAKCGAAWATACVYLLNPLPVPAYYKVTAMMTWPYSSRAAVIRHETNHALARACDQYRGGCPRASDGVWEGSVVCTGNPDTLMDCGGAAKTATFFDYQTFVTAYPASTPFLQQISCNGTGNPAWSPCLLPFGRWVFQDNWSWEPQRLWWFNPNGQPEWSACNGDKLRWNLYLDAKADGVIDGKGGGWYQQGHGFYEVERAFWSYAPAC